jgi:hypothetical protein
MLNPYYAAPPVPYERDDCGVPQPLYEVHMATTSNQTPEEPQDENPEGTFETDISETDDEGSTVRQAEVNADDLSEIKDGDKH